MSSDHRHHTDHSPPQAGEAAAAFCAHGRHAHHADASADVIARLEWLDDLIFAAIDADPAALDTAGEAWRRTVDELGSDALEESRLQYLRRAESVWHELRNRPNHPPHKVFAAIEIISLLAGKAW